LMTVWDSATRRRSDGALVRVITPLEGVESKSVIEAVDVSSQLAVSLNDFVPN
jgi:hypothetical protein